MYVCIRMNEVVVLGRLAKTLFAMHYTYLKMSSILLEYVCL